MMPWNSPSPVGSISVKANRIPMNENTAYIEETLGNQPIGSQPPAPFAKVNDHFWNIDANHDGRHRFVQSPGFTDSGGLPTDPVLGSQMDQVFYAKLKDAAESTAQQDVQPFCLNSTGIAQMLGIRAMAVFDCDGAGNPNALLYSHNITSIVKGAVTGLFTVTFANALPSVNYLVLGGAIRNTNSADNSLNLSVQAGNGVLTTVKTTTNLRLMTYRPGDVLANPLQAWFICFGG